MYYTDKDDGVDSNENFLKNRPNSNSFVNSSGKKKIRIKICTKKIKLCYLGLKRNGANVFQTF